MVFFDTAFEGHVGKSAVDATGFMQEVQSLAQLHRLAEAVGAVVDVSHVRPWPSSKLETFLDATRTA